MSKYLTSVHYIKLTTNNERLLYTLDYFGYNILKHDVQNSENRIEQKILS